MSLPAGVQKFEEDKWSEERDVVIAGVQHSGVLGTRLIRRYSVPWIGPGSAQTLTSLGFVEGADLPDRPATGIGSSAVIETVTRQGKPATGRQIVEVVALEAKGWS